MPAGLQLFGPDGSLWADTNLMPAGLIKSGRFAGNVESQPIYVVANSPVIFFRTVGGNYWAPPTVLPEQMARVNRVAQSGSVWTFFCEINSDPTTGYVEYYIFDTNIGYNGNYGLQVWNQNGVLIFNSNYPPMKTSTWVRADDEYGYGYRLYGTTYVPLTSRSAFSFSIYRRGFTSSETEQVYSDFYKTYYGLTHDLRGVFSYAVITETVQVGGPEGAWTNQSVPFMTIADVSNCPVPFN